ncbi:MAG: peptide ABC transporter ATP-binding protein [Anaerolineaceae bacterium 4572_5.1]|nr:MAG: peptide ABC transporter ATP-binding protein [Anaerolineaceae bacterium 4572_5.1]
MTSEKTPIVEVRHLKKYFPVTGGFFQNKIGDVKAVDDVSFDIYQGETLGLVGETGCGKTTVGRTMMRLYEPTEGEIIFEGTDLATLGEKALRQARSQMQMIFQDPYASLNPRMTVGSIVGAPLDVHSKMSKKEKYDRIQDLLDIVGLNPDFVNRYPHEFSGGQRQRIGIARALALEPHLIVCDEPISSLDVSIQAQVVNLLEKLQKELGLTYLFIAHDLSMVRHISDRMAVMYLGKIMELADRDEIYLNSLHPYTQALMSAVPIPDPDLAAAHHRIILDGDIPNPKNPPKGCNFNTRCPIAKEKCFIEEPEYREIEKDHWVACHYAGKADA